MEQPKNFISEGRNETVLYTALFVDDVNLLKEKYPPVYPNEYYHHSTIAFRPKSGRNNLEVGTKHEIAIIGRITSDKVDALLVDNLKSTLDQVSPLRYILFLINNRGLP